MFSVEPLTLLVCGSAVLTEGVGLWHMRERGVSSWDPTCRGGLAKLLPGAQPTVTSLRGGLRFLGAPCEAGTPQPSGPWPLPASCPLLGAEALRAQGTSRQPPQGDTRGLPGQAPSEPAPSTWCGSPCVLSGLQSHTLVCDSRVRSCTWRMQR